jgi:hypothetical protein
VRVAGGRRREHAALRTARIERQHQADMDRARGRWGEGPPGIELHARPHLGWGVLAQRPYFEIDGVLRAAAWGLSRHEVEPGEHILCVSYPQLLAYGSVGSSARLRVTVPVDGYVALRYRGSWLWSRSGTLTTFGEERP